MFSDVLLTVDFDRTLTGPDSRIPQRNLEAVAYFMENGGSFTVNTGRSMASFGKHLNNLPINAPVLMYNGSARWQDGKLTDLKVLELPLWETIRTVREAFPNMNLEIQGVDCHYLINPDPAYVAACEAQKWKYKIPQFGEDLGPFLKFCLVGVPRNRSVAALFDSTQEEREEFDAAQAWIQERWKDKVTVYRATPRIIDVHAKGVSKIAAARQLQQELGKKILVCVGDAQNDIPMLDGADYAYCPADAMVADRYETVCDCEKGAVADVIYEKIPGILNIQP